MAIYHCSVKPIGRSQGRSAIASASYRSGEKLHSEETDRTFDYTKKHGVAHSEIVLPKNAPAEYADRGTLWNAVQKVEKAKDARLAREIEFALPRELSLEEHKTICQKVAQALAGQGMCVDMAIHNPDKKEPNPHCHMMLTTREIDKDGKWKSKERKEYALDDNGNKIPILDEHGNQKIGAKGRRLWKRVSVEDNTWNDEKYVPLWRQLVEDEINNGLEQAGHDERVSCLSLQAQGIDREPTIHEGHTARKIEKQGGVADRCEINREIVRDNAERAEIRAELERLEKEMQELLKALEEAKNAVPEQDPFRIWLDEKCDRLIEIRAQIKEHKEMRKRLDEHMAQKRGFGIVPQEIRELNRQILRFEKELPRLKKERERIIGECMERSGEMLTTTKDVLAYRDGTFETEAMRRERSTRELDAWLYRENQKRKPEPMPEPDMALVKEMALKRAREKAIEEGYFVEETPQDAILETSNEETHVESPEKRIQSDKTKKKEPKTPKDLPKRLVYKNGVKGYGFYADGVFYGGKEKLQEYQDAGITIVDAYDKLKKNIT